VQPNRLTYCPRTLGSNPKLRDFQSSWFTGRQWLEFSVQASAAFCYCCHAAIFLRPVIRPMADTTIGKLHWSKEKVSIDMHGVLATYKPCPSGLIEKCGQRVAVRYHRWLMNSKYKKKQILCEVSCQCSSIFVCE